MHARDTTTLLETTNAQLNQRGAATRPAIDAGSDALAPPVTTFHEEARQLRAIWDANPQGRPGQAQFGEIFDIGGQSAVANFLSGRSPLSLKAALGFARGLRLRLQDFSPRLAKEAISIAKALDELREYAPCVPRGLRHTASIAQDLATQARQLADWCDAQAENLQPNALAPSSPANLLTLNGTATVEALEAGLMALANGLGRDHATRVLQAINGATHFTPIATSLAAEAALIGSALDHDSLEQGEPA